MRGMRRMVATGSTTEQAVAETFPPGLGSTARLEAWRKLEANQKGLTTELWELLEDPKVTDVVINGSQAFVDRGGGLLPANVGVHTAEDSVRLAIQMAAAAGRRLDDASPIVDAVLPGPLRLHAVLPPVSQRGASISLRVLRPRPFTLDELVASGTLTDRTAEVLQDAVANERSLLISGATGAGKTTLLASLLGLVSGDKRIVIIEEVSELAVTHPHVVSLQARPGNIEGEGEVTLEELVRAAMRMRPDRLVLGECRGPELREVLTAFNTGHRGGLVTVHANSVEDVPARLLALGTLAGLGAEVTRTLSESAFDLVVHLERDEGGARHVVSIGYPTGEVVVRA